MIVIPMGTCLAVSDWPVESHGDENSVKQRGMTARVEVMEQQLHEAGPWCGTA